MSQETIAHVGRRTAHTALRASTTGKAQRFASDRTPISGPPLEDHGRQSRPSRRDEILDGAAALFAEFGYYGSSLRDIARHIGISHPGMLHHFPSKGALLDGVIDRLEASAQATLDRTDELCSRPDELVDRIASLYDPTSDAVALLAMLSSEAVGPEYPARYRIARLRRVHEHIIERCVTQLVDRDGRAQGVDPEFVARTGMSLVLGLAAREETVRKLQGPSHRDEPGRDLRAYLSIALVHGVPAPIR